MREILPIHHRSERTFDPGLKPLKLVSLSNAETPVDQALNRIQFLKSTLPLFREFGGFQYFKVCNKSPYRPNMLSSADYFICTDLATPTRVIIIFSVFLVVDAVDVLKNLKKGTKKTLPYELFMHEIMCGSLFFVYLPICLLAGWLVSLSVSLTFDGKKNSSNNSLHRES